MGPNAFERAVGVLRWWDLPALTHDEALDAFEAIDHTGTGHVRFDEVCDWAIQQVVRRGKQRIVELEASLTGGSASFYGGGSRAPPGSRRPSALPTAAQLALL